MLFSLSTLSSEFRYSISSGVAGEMSSFLVRYEAANKARRFLLKFSS